MEEELVWPDPLGRWEASSGIRPCVLAASMQGNMKQERDTLCDNALKLRKRPRPKDLPWNILLIQSDPPTVDVDCAEEFLVHDPLFVEFFNAFLSLPSFPEPICFNVETGGFEVVSDAKQKLAQQIKEAVRSQNLTAKMYRVARRHAFSDIPLIPIEESKEPEEVKIDTSFEVTTLNKDQGIYWIKAERLPIFLESDYYFQYRLARVISQAKLLNDKNEFVVMKIDFTPRPKTVKTSVEVPPPNVEEIIMKEMYVSFGDVRGAAKEAWFTQAKDTIKTEPTFTSLGPKVSAGTYSLGKLSPETTPKSSVFRSHFFGVYSPGLTGPNDSEPPIQDEKILSERLYSAPPEKPFTPRPSDKLHVSTTMLRRNISKGDTEAGEEMVTPGSVVFKWPAQDLQNTETESGIGEMDDQDEDFEKRMNVQPIIDQIYNDGSWEEGATGHITIKSLDDFGSVIVGVVMKKTMAELMETDQRTLEADPRIYKIFPSPELACITMDNLDLCVITQSPDDEEDLTSEAAATTAAVDEEDADSHMTVVEPVHVKWSKDMKKPVEDESDADSLLDSDEDFEERDTHFRRNKDKWHSLSSMKGIMAFKAFLSGTQGEKYWHLWIDIDKGRLIANEEQKQRYILHMRETYYKQGSTFMLSEEDKKKLGLQNLSAWCPEYLLQVQGKVLEPLVLYWAPRYLLKHMLRTHPEKFYLYNQMITSMPVKETDPHPHTHALLPLRPKSCCPRSVPGPELETKAKPPRAKSAFCRREEDESTTAPKVGNRRCYGQDTIERLAHTPSAKYLGLKENKPVKEKRITSASSQKQPVSRRNSVESRSSLVDSERKYSPVATKHSDEGHKKQSKKVVIEDSKSSSTFVGRLPGIKSTTETPHRVRSTSSSADSEVKTVSKKPCPLKSMEAVLGDVGGDRASTGQALGVVKKPKDLLSPILRIVDSAGAETTSKVKRNASAPARRESGSDLERMIFYRQISQESSKACGSLRPTSAPPGHGTGQEAVPVADMRDCDFMGSQRMEFLLQALHHEHDSGGTFRKYLDKSENENWLNCLDFWEQVQEYRKLFYKDKLDLFQINKKAKAIFAQCIVEGAPRAVGVSDSIELQIMNRLNPAFEDLFDEAELHALKVLFTAFQLYLTQDVKTYCKVERLDVTRRLETKNTYILNLQKQGIIKERPLTPDDPMEGFVDPVYDESLLEKLPPNLRDMTLEKLVQNRLELENFRQYLAQNYAEMDLKCWMDMEAWRRTPPHDVRKRDQRARDIKKHYLNKKYFFGPSSPAGKEGQNKVMEVGGGWGKFLEDKPASASILEAQKYVAERLQKKHLPMFLLSADYDGKKHYKLSLADSAEDVVIKKKMRTDLVLKLLESKWVSSTKEIFIFQRALQNPLTRQQFQQYVAIRGDNLENDLLFYVEVQKYKEMHHVHTEDALIQQKITAIIHCFIDSAIPPSLQIDIPQEMADRVLDHKHEKGPYLFREAQLAVFRILLAHWQPFCEFRNNIGTQEKVMSTLERHRALARKKEMEYREEMERQRERENKEQQALLPRKGKKTVAAVFQERLLRAELGLGETDEIPDELLEDQDDDDKDKITFSYSDYLANLAAEFQNVDDISSLQRLAFEVDDNGSQTIRSTADKSVGVNSRPGSGKSEKPATKEDSSLEQETSTRRGSSQLDKRRLSQISGKLPEGNAQQGEQEKQEAVKVTADVENLVPVMPQPSITVELVEPPKTSRLSRHIPPLIKPQ